MAVLLHGLKVVEVSTGIAAAYCGKLLSDAGADVTMIERPSGHPLRHRIPPVPGASGTALFEFLAAGKRSVVADPAGLSVDELVSNGAGILIEDGTGSITDDLDLFGRRPGLVITSISPFGRSGPWAGRAATDLTVQAWSGSVQRRGLAERSPLQAGGEITEWLGGSYAAAATLGLWWGAHHTGRGGHLDVSLLECAALTLHPFGSLDASFRGGVLAPSAGRSSAVPSIEPCADGYIGFSTVTTQQFRDFLVMIGSDLADDTSLTPSVARRDRRDEVVTAIRAWTATHTQAEIVELAKAFRIPVAPIGNGRDVVNFDHLVERGVFEPDRGAGLRPRIPYRITRSERPLLTDAPLLADTPPVGAGPTGLCSSGGSASLPGRQSESAPDGAARIVALPLEGIRIADFTAFWSGPSATHFLACLGADVIKIESLQRPDGMRCTTAAPDEPRWWEWGPIFFGANSNKRSVTLDLSRPDGRALAVGLIEWADIVIENFSPRVMEQFSLGWDQIAELNPRAIMVRMPAFGLNGPWRDRTGFAMTVEQTSGLAWRTGYADGAPTDIGGACDPLGGMHAVVATIVALTEREHTGTGSLVEAPLIEAALNVAAEQVLQYSKAGVLLSREGNRSAQAAPQGIYACQGTEQWTALSVCDDDQWTSLEHLLDDPPWMAEQDLATHEGRTRHHDRIDDELARWFATQDRDVVVEALAAAGIPAAAVVGAIDLPANPQLRARGFFEELDHVVVGRHAVPALPFRLVGHPEGWLRTPPPTLGEHNEEVLGGLLGASPGHLEALARQGIIGDHLP